MIRNIQIEGEPDTHPERPVHDISDLMQGRIDMSKLKVKAKHVEIFDLMDEAGRKAYETLYVVLSGLVNEGKAFIEANRREVLTKADGSTGWFKYLEWIEYDLSGILGA